ncbi:MAG: YdbL family protein [Xanthomonadaceae bacterium]|nr:YdbL family protein [Xanthomonadaceae bacterium]
MKKTFLLLAAALLTACVTINVYFPAAEAREAAREFVEEVIGEGAADQGAEAVPTDENRGAFLSPVERVLDFFIPVAHAQSANIDIKTPAIQAIQARMAQRFQSQLQAHFDSGALGFTRDGLIVVRDPGKLPLSARVGVNQQVAEDNRDRNAVYREIAVANGHPEWEGQIREIFASQWVASARSGWWYQDNGGTWKQK